MLCTVVCAGLLTLGLSTRQGIADDKTHEFLPIADGMIFDQTPFDGLADGVEENISNAVFLTSNLGESRVAMEFDISPINVQRIESASLRLVPVGRGILPGTLRVPIQVMGYQGDGSIQNSDFNSGCFVTVFDALATPDNVPVTVDVTEFVRGLSPAKQPVIGFTLRTNVHGSQINYGSVEFGSAPTLIVTLK